ncbi:TPA: hypothetical protein QC100_004041 [Bacillus thuringiensis]|nr:hypothetical protein [Bacillus thuringiensis]
MHYTERGKPITWKDLIPSETLVGKGFQLALSLVESITYFYIGESSGTVPKKPR